ncbi:MAG: (Fe-S)-binding protein [Candidatus Thorarchaeota archaeon]
MKSINRPNLPTSGDVLQNVISMVNYCYSCNRCDMVCPLSHLGIFSPRNLVTDLILSSVEDALKNHNIWDCLTCGQCTIYCPMTQENVGVRIPELILELRKLSFNNETEKTKIRQCETHDGIFEIIPKIQANRSLHPNKLDFLEGTQIKIAESGEIAYFIGCMPLMQEMLYKFGINYTDSGRTILSLLNEADKFPVVLNEKCCGHDALWGRGDIETFKKLAEYNVQLYKKAGVKTIIVGCAEGYRTWKYDYPKVIKDFNFEILHFSEFFLRENIFEKVRFPQGGTIRVTYHDSCRLGRLGGKLYDVPRKLIKMIPGVELIEMENIRDDSSCCGIVGFMNCNEYSRLLRENRIKEAINTGAEYLIVPCPKCLTHFKCYLNEQYLNEDNKELNNKIKVIDLACFIGKFLFLC